MSISNIYQNEKAELPVKILQFGGGNFLRGYFDWMVQKMNQDAEFKAGVVVVQPLRKNQVSDSRTKKDDFKDQNYNYTLSLQGIKNGHAIEENEIIYCIKDSVNPYSQFREYLKYSFSPTLKFVVSNTTEAGIVFDSDDINFATTPITYPGKLTIFLYERFKAFSGSKDSGLYILPLELLEDNGKKLKKAVLQYVNLWELGTPFRNWLDEANVFYNTLVDRIVPGYPKEKPGSITEKLGYEDKLLVQGEQFHLLAIEGPKHIQQVFPAEKATLNIIFTDDLNPYRLRKVRILNGTHTAMVPVAYLSGLETVGEAMDDKQVGEFIEAIIFEEIIPGLACKENDIKKFALDTIDRFKNPYIKHYLMSISLNSFSKFEARVLPSILEFHQIHHKWPERLIFSFASLLVFYRGTRGKDKIKLNDEEKIIQLMKQLWGQLERQEITTETLVTVALADYFSQNIDLNKKEGLKELLVKQLDQILHKGINQALQDLKNHS